MTSETPATPHERSVFLSPNNTWINLGVAAILLSVPAALWSKFGQVDNALGITTNEIKHLREGQQETNATLREISSKLDGESSMTRTKIGEHGARLTSLEQWRAEIERRLTGNGK